MCSYIRLGQKLVVWSIPIRQKQLVGLRLDVIFPFYGTTLTQIISTVQSPCARSLTKDEVEVAYEKDTGLVIVEEFERRGLNPC